MNGRLCVIMCKPLIFMFLKFSPVWAQNPMKKLLLFMKATALSWLSKASRSNHMFSERRKYRRHQPKKTQYAVLSWTSAEHGNGRVPAQVNDLSLGGCRLVIQPSSYTPGPPGSPATVTLPLAAKPLGLDAELIDCVRTVAGTIAAYRFKFLGMTLEQTQQLALAITGESFVLPDTVNPGRQHWAAPQWVAYITAQPLPVLHRSKDRLDELSRGEGALSVAATAFEQIVNEDPFLCLALLREAERLRARRMGHETTTVMAAIMQIGVDKLHDLLVAAPDVVETPGLIPQVARSVRAGHLATAWGPGRADIAPAEISLAALLAETGELLLWHFAPDLPQAASEVMLANLGSMRTRDAQTAACGFTFRDLTMHCADAWGLPSQIMQMVKGQNTPRARLARLCVDVCHHLELGGGDNPLLPTDLLVASSLLPYANSVDWLVAQLPGLLDEQRQHLAKATRDALADNDDLNRHFR
ncbi:PilZ domain-containing protein [Propionivibrio sp.]|uniref:PilZ domain-containing protein n=1 Tax=Propionivibrio sp. TaxID=2212460 RepID=UPI003BF2BCB6